MLKVQKQNNMINKLLNNLKKLLKFLIVKIQVTFYHDTCRLN
jgi:hypothetical protein